jgi:hypothetical protein
VDDLERVLEDVLPVARAVLEAAENANELLVELAAVGLEDRLLARQANMILELGAETDKDAIGQTNLTAAGQELMALWDQVDRGKIKQDQAFEAADEAVRKRNAALDKEM